MMIRRAFNTVVTIIAIAGLLMGILLLIKPNEVLTIMVVGFK